MIASGIDSARITSWIAASSRPTATGSNSYVTLDELPVVSADDRTEVDW